MHNLSFPRLLAIAVLATSSTLTCLIPAQAQVTVPGAESPFSSNEIDPTKQGLGGGFDPMSLIHNANLSRSRNGVDFAEDSQRTLNEAADQFKKMQQQRLQEIQQPATDPAIAPAPAQSIGQ
jgi:hypothetical protein